MEFVYNYIGARKWCSLLQCGSCNPLIIVCRYFFVIEPKHGHFEVCC